MNLLRSICCLFGSRCAPEEAKSAGDTMRAEQSVPADLGQKEADLEKTGKEQMSKRRWRHYMDGTAYPAAR